MEHFAKYKKITGPIVVSIEPFDGLVRVSYRYDYPGLDLPRFAVLNEQLLLVDLIRTGTGETITPLNVGTPYTFEEASLAVFGCHVEKTEGNELVFKKSAWVKPFLTANNVMLDYLEPQLKERLAEAMTSESFTGLVQQKLYQAIPSGAFSIEDIAATLGISSPYLATKPDCRRNQV